MSHLPIDMQVGKGSADPDNSVHAKLAKEEEKEPANQEGDNPMKRDEDSDLKLKNE